MTHSTTIRPQRPGELWNIQTHGLAIRTYLEADARDDFAGTQLALWCDSFDIPTGVPLCEAAYELIHGVRQEWNFQAAGHPKSPEIYAKLDEAKRLIAAQSGARMAA